MTRFIALFALGAALFASPLTPLARACGGYGAFHPEAQRIEQAVRAHFARTRSSVEVHAVLSAIDFNGAKSMLIAVRVAVTRISAESEPRPTYSMILGVSPTSSFFLHSCATSSTTASSSFIEVSAAGMRAK